MTLPSLSAPDPTAPVRHALETLDDLRAENEELRAALAERAQDSEANSTRTPHDSAHVESAEDIAELKKRALNALDHFWNLHPDEGPRITGARGAVVALSAALDRLAESVSQTAEALAASEVRLAATEAERDEAILLADQWEQAHGVRGRDLAAMMADAKDAEASEARSAKLEAALREIEKDSSLLGGLVQFSDSPQGTLIGEIRKTARAALVSSPAAEGEQT